MLNISIVMCSGGIDSTVVLYQLFNKGVRNIYPVIVNYGQKNFKTELKHLYKVNPYPKESIIVVDVSKIYSLSDSKLLKEVDLWNDNIYENENFVPQRSRLLITIASIIAENLDAKEIYFGFIDTKNVNSFDCKKEYLLDLFETFKEEKFCFNLPLIEMSKLEVVQLGLKYKAPLSNTYSCHNNINYPCGVCPNCIDRNKAFKGVREWKRL